MDEKEQINIDEGADLASFFEKNRRPLFILIVVIGIGCVGFTGTMIVREELNKRATAALEPLIERYEVILKSAEYTALTKDAQAAEAGTGADGTASDTGGAAGTEGADVEAETTADAANAGVEASGGAAAAKTPEKAPETIASYLIDITEFAGSHSGYPAAEAWSIAAHLKAKQGKWAEAEENYLKSATAGKKTHLAPLSYFNAAVCAEEQDKTDEALLHYGEAVLYPDFPQGAHAQFAIGRIYETAQKKDEALEAYQAVIDKWPDAETWTALAHRQLIALGE